MWARINEAGEDFWSHLEKYEWADRLVDGLTEKFGLTNTFMLSDAGKFPKTLSGKQIWLHDNYPQFVGRTVFTSHKQLLAHKRAILIDDKPSNVNAFESNEGVAFLFPQPWNLHVVKGIDDPDKFVSYLLH